MIGIGSKVTFTEDHNDLIDLNLIDFNLQGRGNSEYSARMDLIENAREIGATHIYKMEVYSNQDFTKLVCYGGAFGPKKNS